MYHRIRSFINIDSKMWSTKKYLSLFSNLTNYITGGFHSPINPLSGCDERIIDMYKN